MAIDVVCPSCKTRFQVSEKFAGKQGPCPKCKAVILVPTKQEAVVIHEPEPTGPKTSTGESVLRPILRQEATLSQPVILGIVGAIFAVLLFAVVLRIQYHKTPQDFPLVLMILGAIVLAPPLALAGYTFLRDAELAPHRGKDLWLRLGVCSAAYPALWGIYWFVFAYLGISPELMHLTVVGPIVLAVGAFVAYASLDLDYVAAALHYSLYLIVIVLLRVIIGLEPHWTPGL